MNENLPTTLSLVGDFILSDYLTMVCIVFVLARSALTTAVLLWGNNNMTRPALNMTETEIYHRTVESKLTLANRAIYTTYLWIQKSNVLLLCERVLTGLPEPEMIVKVYWLVLLGSLVAVMGTTFGECWPAHLYWQVMPNPGDCVKANIQLVTLVALNITTDAMLIVLPMPWLLRVRKSWLKRQKYVLLFSSSGTAQVNRDTWGSVEEFFAVVAANHEEGLSNSGPPASARPRFTPNQFQDSALFTTNVALDTVEETREETRKGRFSGHSRGRSLREEITAAPSQENLVRAASSHAGECDDGNCQFESASEHHAASADVRGNALTTP
ncbi:hypothetical protein BDW66DRAFT_159654 [Aspergillus desertorum]